jgi:arylsulfatase A-like enzyme
MLALLVPVLTSCGGSKGSEKPHILFITIDTLRRDHLGAYGYARNTSPFIDRMAKEGTMFKHVVTPIPSTASSHSTMMTSLHPLTHGITSNAAPLTEKVQTIAEVMQKNGYHTVGAVSVVFLSAKYHFNQGFDSFDDTWDTKAKYNESFQRVAEYTNQGLFKQIDEYQQKHKDKPLFIWVHYFDPHFIYHNRKRITFKNKPERLGDNKQMLLYDKEIRYTDEHIEKLYKYLEGKGITKKLVTCITADHGEQFKDHGASACHADFYSENTYVPLILHGDGIPGNKTIDRYVTTLDIAPTLLGRCNLSFDYPVEGVNLLEHLDEPDKYPKRKLLVIGNAKYTRSLQLMDYPYAYILNFDYHYKNWYLAVRDIDVPEAAFQKLKKRYLATGKKNVITARFPYFSKKGLNYIVVKGNIKKNNGLDLQVKMLPHSLTQKVKVAKDAKTFTIVYPLTIRDRFFVLFHPQSGTEIDPESVRYALISDKQLPTNAGLEKLDNQVHKKMMTLRKDKTQSELYDVSTDVDMIKDIAADKKFISRMVGYKKLIYGAYKFFYQKRSKLLKGTMQKESYSEKEKEMLKSLGYL